MPSRSVRTTTPRTFQQRQNRMGKNTPVSSCPESDGFVSNTPLVSSSSGEGGPKDPPPFPSPPRDGTVALHSRRVDGLNTRCDTTERSSAPACCSHHPMVPLFLFSKYGGCGACVRAAGGTGGCECVWLGLERYQRGGGGFFSPAHSGWGWMACCLSWTEDSQKRRPSPGLFLSIQLSSTGGWILPIPSLAAVVKQWTWQGVYAQVTPPNPGDTRYTQFMPCHAVGVLATGHEGREISRAAA